MSFGKIYEKYHYTYAELAISWIQKQKLHLRKYEMANVMTVGLCTCT